LRSQVRTEGSYIYEEVRRPLRPATGCFD
jgi:hypothetical protein